MPSLRDSRDALGRLPVATRLAWGFGFLVALLMVLTCAGLLLLGQDPALQSQRQMLGLIGSAAMVAAGMVAWLMVDSLKWPLDRTLDFAERLADGDDTAAAPKMSADEFGQLQHALIELRDRLRRQGRAAAADEMADEPLPESFTPLLSQVLARAQSGQGLAAPAPVAASVPPVAAPVFVP